MSGTLQSSRPESDSPYNRPVSSSAPSTNGQDHGDTQRSLQQASVALEVAYNRIRQVRRSLRELSESLPIADNLPHFSMNFNELEPGHEALLLVGDGPESERELSMGFDATTDFTAPPASNLSLVQQSTTTGDARGANEALLNRMDRHSILFQPLFTPHVLPPRFSRRELSNEIQYLQRRGITYDSGSTLRGIRVAAREAQGREVHGLHVDAEPTERDRPFRGPAIDSMHPVISSNSPPERQNSLGRNVLDNRRAGQSPPLPTAPPMWRAPDPRRWRMRPEIYVNHRLQNADAPDQFPNLPTQSNASYSTDMPRNVPQLPLPTESRLLANPTTAFERYHSYPERTRLEDMTNISTDWSDDDFISWLFPAQQSDMPLPRQLQQTDLQPNRETIRITRTTDTAVSPREDAVPRRGWARLDADGNEIPPNEEEELERSRTAYRLQASQRSRQNATGSSREGPIVGGVLDNFGDQRNVYGSVLDSTLSIQDTNRQPEHRQPLGNDLPTLYIDPLPMPLSSMTLAVDEKKGRHRDIFVPRHACLAGR